MSVKQPRLKRPHRSLREYERRKAAWVATNPSATPQTYEAAVQKIVKELGI